MVKRKFLYGQKYFEALTNQVFSLSRADQTEVVAEHGIFGLTRFAQNRIHQANVREHSSVSVRVVFGKKIGVASTNRLDKTGLLEVVKHASEIARFQREDPHFVSLPSPKSYLKIDVFNDKTATCTPWQRAQVIGKAIALAQKKGLTASGAFSTGASELCVANSLEVFAYHPDTLASFSTVMMGEDSSGFAQESSNAVENLKPLSCARKAIGKALLSARPVEIPSGDYTVVLEESAVNEMLIYLSYLGFGARPFHEGVSFLSERLGEQVMGERVFLWDNALDQRGLPIPFDFEGMPKVKTALVEAGKAVGVAYDSYYAQRYGRAVTGHALPAPNSLGPLPTHLVMKEGEHTLKTMIASVKKGLLVTRFWYVNGLHHKILNITGMTRDGTFLIENGKIMGGVKNLRFTQSIPEAFSRISMLGKKARPLPSWFGANLIVPIKIDAFHFSGSTLF